MPEESWNGVVAQVMEKPWFQNRKCLDIGCNEGMVTLGLVTRFGTASMLGVDIDQVLISKACRCALPSTTPASSYTQEDDNA